MSGFVIDIAKLWSSYFKSPFTIIPGLLPATPVSYEEIALKTGRSQSIMGRDFTYKNAKGIEVFAPVTIKSGIYEITIDCITMRVQGKKHVVNTPMVERVGSVKEEYPVSDYLFSCKGVLIAADGIYPDNEIMTLRSIFESSEPVYLDNVLSDLFLDKSNKVIISSFDLLEETTGTARHRPFTLTMESDFIDSLIII